MWTYLSLFCIPQSLSLLPEGRHHSRTCRDIFFFFGAKKFSNHVTKVERHNMLKRNTTFSVSQPISKKQCLSETILDKKAAQVLEIMWSLNIANYSDNCKIADIRKALPLHIDYSILKPVGQLLGKSQKEIRYASQIIESNANCLRHKIHARMSEATKEADIKIMRVIRRKHSVRKAKGFINIAQKMKHTWKQIQFDVLADYLAYRGITTEIHAQYGLLMFSTDNTTAVNPIQRQGLDNYICY